MCEGFIYVETASAFPDVAIAGLGWRGCLKRVSLEYFIGGIPSRHWSGEDITTDGGLEMGWADGNVLAVWCLVWVFEAYFVVVVKK